MRVKLYKQGWVTGLIFSMLFQGQAFAQDFLGEIKMHKELNSLVTGHSFCSAKLGSEKVEAASYRSKELVPLASISKLLTSYWALSKLGPFFRFETTFYIKNVDAQRVDLHIAGSRDPYYTYEKMFFIISELNRLGIKKVRRLSFDENLTVYMGHRDPTAGGVLKAWTEDPDLVTGVVTQERTEDNLELMFKTSNWGRSAQKRYLYTKNLAATKGVEMVAKPSFTFEEIKSTVSDDLHPEAWDSSVVLKSAPLIRYLKDMNNFSNNYVADQLFLYLGGASAFAGFAKANLNLDGDDLRIYTGSGLPLRETIRVDNHGSCAAVLKVIDSMSRFLKKYKITDEDKKVFSKSQLDLFDAMLVVGVDRSESINGLIASTTYGGADDQEESVLVKTGLVNSAVNIAGAVYTAEGVYLFGIFLRTAKNPNFKNAKAASEAREARREIISDLIKAHGGGQKIPFSSHWAFMPIDTESALTPVPLEKLTLLGLN